MYRNIYKVLYPVFGMPKGLLTVTVDLLTLQRVRESGINISGLVNDLLRAHLNIKDEGINSAQLDSELLTAEARLLELQGLKRSILLKKQQEDKDFNKKYKVIDI